MLPMKFLCRQCCLTELVCSPSSTCTIQQRLRQGQVCFVYGGVVAGMQLAAGLLELRCIPLGAAAIYLCDGATLPTIPLGNFGGAACWQRLARPLLGLIVTSAVQARGEAMPGASATMAAWGRKFDHEGLGLP